MTPKGIRLADVIGRFGGELIGEPNHRIVGVATLRSATPAHASFCHRGKYLDELRASKAGVVIIAPADRDAADGNRILSDNPYLYFARVSTLLNPDPSPPPGVHSSASVHASARIGPDVSIGPHCAVGANGEIGEGVVVLANSTIGDHVLIGEGSRIDAGVTIYPNTIIGKRCVILSGAVIGADGFGFAPDGQRWVRIPQIGRVCLGDDVEVGANTTIDRGALDDTIIEEGVKIDNQVQIGHNCRIGAHTAIAGCVGIAGSTTLGRRCMIGGAAMIAGHLELADGVVVSGGTLISKSIREPGVYTGVYPFETNRRWTRNAATLRHLDEMRARVIELERRLPDSGKTS
ncbi:MAG: UDP-3-O-(3-hydroxymyristoyl)glucosamine N-acyltransferase [Burkholderiales bacterium]